MISEFAGLWICCGSKPIGYKRKRFYLPLSGKEIEPSVKFQIPSLCLI